MLIWYYIVLIFRVDGLVVRRNVDLIIRELVFAEVFEEVRVPGSVEVNVGIGGVFGLDVVSEGRGVLRGARSSECTIFHFEGVL
jgi:hypothetical protein